MTATNGRAAVRAGELVRALLMGLALARKAQWVAGWHEDSGPAKAWIKAAMKLPFVGGFKWPKRANLATLAAHPDRGDGTLVTVEGTLGQVKIVHKGKKVISSAILTDSAGNSITIVLPYIKLDSGGMAEGCFARIAGVWNESSKETGGPALLIDRRNLQDEGKTSWSSWVEAELISVFEAVPHALAASFSWEIGVDGAGNSLRYGTWRRETERSK